MHITNLFVVPNTGLKSVCLSNSMLCDSGTVISSYIANAKISTDEAPPPSVIIQVYPLHLRQDFCIVR